MKKANKMKLTVMAALIGASAQSALASAGSFNCVASNHQSFNFQLDGDPIDYESAVYSGSASDLHGMNVAIRSLPVKILVSPILTRTVVGFHYNFTLPGGAKVSLAHITFASQSFGDQLGIRGHAELENGGVATLRCRQYQ